ETLRTQPSEDVAFLSYATSAVFSPLPYVVPAIFAAATVASGAGFLPALWISRTANLLLGCFLIWLAIRKARELTELLVLLGLLPMFLFLRSSVSADLLTISASWLFVSIVIDEFASDRENTWQKAACAALLIFTKPLFLLVTLLGLVRPLTRQQWRSALLVGASIVVSGLIAAQITASALMPIRSDVATDPQGQMTRTIRESPEVVSLIVRHAITSAPRYAVEAIGRLGWLDTPVPGPATVLIAALLLIASVTARSAEWLTLRLRMILLLVGLAGFFAVLWSNFVLWTPVPAVDIEGAQGRHFLPLAPLFLIPVMGLAETGTRWRTILVWLGMFFSCAITIWVIVDRYWL
ncbi:MAG: DUF2142 domain-containing protein, partial [Acidobacteria bacterium]|nr:DUF2142 domain-containing protein [Acidobacteriota bacterium]